MTRTSIALDELRGESVVSRGGKWGWGEASKELMEFTNERRWCLLDRYRSKGHGLLFLLPSEVGILEELKNKRVTMKKVAFQENRFQSIVGKLGGFLVVSGQHIIYTG